VIIGIVSCNVSNTMVDACFVVLLFGLFVSLSGSCAAVGC
jgi:hypothetical protein